MGMLQMQATIGGLELPKEVQLAYGLVPFVVPIRKFGHNHDVGISTEDVHPGGGAYPFPAAAETLGVVSDDANDAADGTVATISIGAAGTGYTQNDTLTVIQSGGVGLTVNVDTVGGGGDVTAVSITTSGYGYSVANNLAVTGGTGNDDCEIDVDTLVSSTGARTIQIEGLDADYAEISEVVYLKGATEVVTTALFLRVNRVIVLTAGSTGTNEGTLSIDNTTSSDSVVQVDPGEGGSMAAVYTVPVGYEGVLVNVRGAALGNVDAEFGVQVREQGGAWQQKEHYAVGTGAFDLGYVGVDKYPEKSDIRMTAISTQASMEVIGSFSLYLIQM